MGNQDLCKYLSDRGGHHIKKSLGFRLSTTWILMVVVVSCKDVCAYKLWVVESNVFFKAGSYQLDLHKSLRVSTLAPSYSSPHPWDAPQGTPAAAVPSSLWPETKYGWMLPLQLKAGRTKMRASRIYITVITWHISLTWLLLCFYFFILQLK